MEIKQQTIGKTYSKSVACYRSSTRDRITNDENGFLKNKHNIDTLRLRERSRTNGAIARRIGDDRARLRLRAAATRR